MTDVNPYSPTQEVTADDYGIRRVKVRPIDLLKRAQALVGDKYWLFLGITLVGILVGSAVPMGILIGPMMAGIYLCFIHREQGVKVEFNTLFKGFDQFMDTLLAWILMFCASLVVMVPFMIALFVIVFMPVMQAAAAAQNGPPPPPELPVAIFILYPIMLIANVLVTLPFVFVFQLIVDRQVKAMAAVRLSFQGVWKNLLGVLWYFFVLMVISMILAMMCYVPAILFLPISLGSMYLLYRDIYGPGIQFTQPPPPADPVPPAV